MAGIKTISLFSGCGGSDVALTELGFDIAFANDIWELACLTYQDNIPNSKITCGDIADFVTFPHADLLVGCYPCQGFTQGGRRDWGESVNFLYQQFDRVLRKTKPMAFVVENVNGMAYGPNQKLLSNQLCRYRLAGYRVKWSVLNAQDFGVAQSRRRVFIVGVRSDLAYDYTFPEPTHGPDLHQALVSQCDVLEGLPEWPTG